ncbi:hypothetical protein MMC19_001412 [Ptychographa xylographoides]|nr:hypothetical protein [Ptychographa xylographoides]
MSIEEPIHIHPARSASDLSAVKRLFAAYAEWLAIDLTFQAFATELSTLPGRYAGPEGGELLLARDAHGNAVGCIALRSMPEASETLLPDKTLLPRPPSRCCELKRLYTLPACRGMGVGRKLVEAVLRVAEERGYQEARLDTLPSMDAARGLYEKLGFTECEAYYETPVRGTLFLGRRLDPK